MDGPLLYSFGFSPTGAAEDVIPLSVFRPEPRLSVKLPAGRADTGYKVSLVVTVKNAAGVTASSQLGAPGAAAVVRWADSLVSGGAEAQQATQRAAVAAGAAEAASALVTGEPTAALSIISGVTEILNLAGGGGAGGNASAPPTGGGSAPAPPDEAAAAAREELLNIVLAVAALAQPTPQARAADLPPAGTN